MDVESALLIKLYFLPEAREISQGHLFMQASNEELQVIDIFALFNKTKKYK